MKHQGEADHHPEVGHHPAIETDQEKGTERREEVDLSTETEGGQDLEAKQGEKLITGVGEKQITDTRIKKQQEENIEKIQQRTDQDHTGTMKPDHHLQDHQHQRKQMNIEMTLGPAQ